MKHVFSCEFNAEWREPTIREAVRTCTRGEVRAFVGAVKQRAGQAGSSGGDEGIYEDLVSHMLYEAVRQEKSHMVKMLIQTPGADVNWAHQDETTTLCLASIRNDTQYIKLLLEAGADVNTSDCHCQTPLFKAAEGHPECVGLLLEAGAYVNQANDGCKTPLFKAAEGHPECVKLLLGAGADVNHADDDHATPIFRAAVGHIECVKLLLEAGADVNKADNWCKTPLSEAALGHDQCVKLLLEAGADVNEANCDWKTPLFIA